MADSRQRNGLTKVRPRRARRRVAGPTVRTKARPQEADHHASPADGSQADAQQSSRRQAHPATAAGQVEEPQDARPVKVVPDLAVNQAYLKRALGAEKSFDVLVRELKLAGRPANLLAIDGFIKDDVMLLLVQFLNGHGAALSKETAAEDMGQFFLKQGVGYLETDPVETLDEVVTGVLAGQTAIIIDGLDFILLADMRTYPARQPDEPELERVIRGPRDGFTETLIENTALVRRRLRDPRLRVELSTVGQRSKTDVALLYIEDIADPHLVDKIRNKINNIVVDGIPMAERSVEEFLLSGSNRLSLLPKVRFTERPDVTAVHLLEGHLAIITDTSPIALLLPVTFFHHLQHAQEFHEEPLSGIYVRWLRFFGVLLSWIGPALWLAASLSTETLPPWLSFIGPKDGPGPIPLYMQLIFAEMGIDLIRLALIHTPSALASSLGIIGAILLGELAVEVGLFVPETILYVALATIGNFATPSVELANAIRIHRLFFLLLAGLGGWPLLGVGLLIVLLNLMRTRSFGIPYLWPLVPFNGPALIDVLFRMPVRQSHARPSILRPQDKDRG